MQQAHASVLQITYHGAIALGVGEGMDLHTVRNGSEAGWVRGLSAASLTLSVWTSGTSPNASAVTRNLDDIAELGSKIARSSDEAAAAKNAAKGLARVDSRKGAFPTGARASGDADATARYADIIDADDIAALAKNANLPENVIASVKKHIFETVHRIPVGPNKWRVSRFEPDDMIADVWEAAVRGDRIGDFRNFVGHEYMEHILMKHHGLPYRSAHPSVWDAGTNFPTLKHFGAHDISPIPFGSRAGTLSDRQVQMWVIFLSR